MTCAAHNGSEVLRQRSYWLRCFLGPSPMLLALTLCTSPIASANVCVSQTLHIFRIHGHVTDQFGENIPGARISLKRAGIAVLESPADDTGDFRLKVKPGKYDLYVQAPGFEHGWAPLKVGFGPKSWFRANTLYVALAVGSLNCPPNVTTSYREFKRQIRASKVEFEEHKQKNATQR